ncbi:ACTR8 [Cordylochernes scorpioides]|uniref:ACTR8 n=1 Tax=Cordylochernes scorpioides TaxID=51811 RepID=A0ABY6KAZ6_9ARAC|nr:ACTR8 [Cordylochernes scorpioides]
MNVGKRANQPAGCFLQESVCATFGAGLSTACVVDVGDQKISVACVEDGISHRSSRYVPPSWWQCRCCCWMLFHRGHRIHQEFGGSDLTLLFHRLLQQCGFPYQECQPLTSRLDAALLTQLKETFCHVNLVRHLSSCSFYAQLYFLINFDSLR